MCERKKGTRVKHHTNWVRRFEHTVLRIASFVFSIVSAHAILWFFSALNHIDHLQPYVTWGIAVGFGVLGYFVSRGLAHRLLNKEPVRAYIFICGVFELVEVVCNYAMAAVAVQWITWLGLVPAAQRNILTFLTYVVLSIIPVVTVMLAWVDMDLERAKQGYEVRGFGMRPSAYPSASPAPLSALSQMPGMQARPKMAHVPYTNMQVPVAPLAPSYPQGYQGTAAAPSAPVARSVAPLPSVALGEMAVPAPAASGSSTAGGWWNGLRTNMDRATSLLPFGNRPATPIQQAPLQQQ
jgi:hypothetical protein